MTFHRFMDRISEVLPPGKPLSANQWAAYEEKFSKFSEEQIQKLYDAVLEQRRFFPKIADIYEQAKLLGFLESKTEYRPHVWTKTDCQLCVGSGLIAAFWSQEFEVNEDSKTQILRLHYLFPFHQSAEYHQRKDHDDVRTPYRCFCPAGGVDTLDRGIPRWHEGMPEVRRRDWAA